MQKKNPKRPRFLLRFLVLVIVLCLGFFIYFVMAINLAEPKIKDRSAEQNQMETHGADRRQLGRNWIRKSESGLWEMYLEGNGFERGIAHGKLSKELAEQQEIAFIRQIKLLVPSDRQLNFLKYFVAYFNRHIPDHIPDEYKDEIYGVSLSASDKFDALAPKYYRILNYHGAHDIGHALQDKNMTVGCTSFAAWDSKTEDGTLLVGRNFDFFAGDDFARNKIVCFTKPENGHPYMFVTWAGFIGVVSGMNNKGLTVTINASKSDIPKSAATPISLLAKEILQYAATIDEAYKIAQQRQTFVSESILIGSAVDKKAAVIEKTPTKTSLRTVKNDQLICSNHFKSAAFEHDYINNKNIVESSSLYREFRMEQLLMQRQPLSPEDAASVLRNQQGLNECHLGLGNEKGINQLIAHHSVIFKPESGLVWVSTQPYQLGKYVCYDLNKIFSDPSFPTENKEIQDTAKSIAADAFLYSPEYKNFLLFRQIRQYLEFCTKNNCYLPAKQTYIRAFEHANPDSYLTYQTLGNYYVRMDSFEKAKMYYQKALTRIVATKAEEQQIRTSLQRLNE